MIPSVIDAFNQEVSSPIMGDNKYASDFGHNLPPGASRFSYPPSGHALGHCLIPRRYDEDRRYIMDMIERNHQNENIIIIVEEEE